MKKTSVIKSHQEPEAKWHLVDANGKILGRLASKIAFMLRGKHRPQFTPHALHGDYIVVINCEKVKVTGNKLTQKMYYNHSQYMGNLYQASLKEILAKDPERVIKDAVRRMLPKTRLGDAMLAHLKIVAGEEHPYIAQKPQSLTL
ncbi:MAG: 50S ribosomal protein L13 [Candidatus Abawacabacteria bacterium]|nr:50S ribosomal protein L13 [Candidatus Abawacabacteria bacterium]